MRLASDSDATRKRLASHVEVEVEGDVADLALTTFAPASRSGKPRRGGGGHDPFLGIVLPDGSAGEQKSPSARPGRGGRKTGDEPSAALRAAATPRTLGGRSDEEPTKECNPQTAKKAPKTVSAPANPEEFTKSDAAIVWFYCSSYPEERGRAGRIFDSLLRCGIEPVDLLEALAEFAIVPDPAGQAHHAHTFTELAARSFAATIRERRRDERRNEESVTRAESIERGAPIPLRVDKPLAKPNWNIFASPAGTPTEGTTWDAPFQVKKS